MVLGIMEGKISILLGNDSCLPGGKITGKVRLEMNQPQDARELRLEFYGEVKQFRGRGTITEAVNNQTIILDGKKAYSGVKECPFEIIAPGNAMPPQPDGVIGAMADFATPKPKYFISSSLDMEMKFDVTSRIPVKILRPAKKD